MALAKLGKELSPFSIGNAVAFAVILPDDETGEDSLGGEIDKLPVEAGVFLKERVVMAQAGGGDSSAQIVKFGEVVGGRNGLQINLIRQARIAQEIFAFLRAVDTVGRRKPRQNIEGIKRRFRVGGVEPPKKGEESFGVGRGLFRFARGEKTTVQELVDR